MLTPKSSAHKTVPSTPKQIAQRIDLNASKSPADEKEYRLIRLENGLECLLISTASEQHSPASQLLHAAAAATTTTMTGMQASDYSKQQHISSSSRHASVVPTTDRAFTYFDQQPPPSRNALQYHVSEDFIQQSKISDVDEEEGDGGEGDFWREGEDAATGNVKSTHSAGHHSSSAAKLRAVSSNLFRDSSSAMASPSAAAAAAVAAGRRISQQTHRPSVVGGVVSGEVGRKLSRIIPTAAASNAQDDAIGATPTLSTRMASSASSRMSISVADSAASNALPPALRLSRLRVVSDVDVPSAGAGTDGLQQQPILSTTNARPPSPRKHRLSNAAGKRGSIMFHQCNSGSCAPVLSSSSSSDLLASNALIGGGGASNNSGGGSLRPSSLLLPSSHGLAQDLETCAVAMGVGTGSFATPPGLDGLAHFLEHMLFMGSKKHPKENEFDSVLSLAGGSSNAFTDTEHTVYHFVAPLPHLHDCLQVFAQFFVAPLLLPECSDRELHSIENEFNSRRMIDRCRLQEIWRETSRRDTAYAKFTCGNLDTLAHGPNESGIDVNRALWEFYEKHYVAANMKFVIVSGEPMQDLECTVSNMLAECRTSTSSSSLERARLVLDGFPWDEHCALGKVFRIVPTGLDVNELQMTWQLDPKLVRAYKSKPCEYIAHLLSHECTGSVINELKSRGWAHELVAGVCLEDGFTHNTGVSLFNITVTLTQAGMSQWIYVAALLFEFLGIIQRQGVKRWIFDELQQVAQIHFRFKEELDARTLVQELCSELLAAETEEDRLHLLDKSHLLFDWDPNTIGQVLEILLNVDKVRIDLLSTRLASKTRVSQQQQQQDEIALLSQCERPTRPPLAEEFTGALYWSDPIPEAVLESWRAVIKGKSTVGVQLAHDNSRGAAAGEEDFSQTLGLPPRNPYISSDFTLKRVREYDAQEHILIGAELKFTLNTLQAKKLSITASSLRRFSNLTVKAGWEFGIVLAFDQDSGSILVRYPAREGLRRWHRLDALASIGGGAAQAVAATAEDFYRKLLAVDFGNGCMVFTSIPRAQASKIPVQSSAFASTTQQDDFDFTFPPADGLLWKRYFPRIPTGADAPDFPTLVSGSDQSFALWALPDTSFRSPRVQLYLSFLTPNVSETPTAAALADLFAVMVYESLVQESYMGFLVDLNFEIEIINGMGIQLHFSGFSHKLMDLLQIVLRRTLFFTQWVCMPQDSVNQGGSAVPTKSSFFKRSSATAQQPLPQPAAGTPRRTSSKRSAASSQTQHAQTLPEDAEFDSFLHYFMAPDQDAPREFATLLFARKFDSLLAEYLTASTRFRSGAQVSSVMFDLLCTSLWTPLEKAQALQRDVTPERLVEFAANLFSSCKVEGLVEGNLDEQSTAQYFKCIRAALQARNSRPIRSDIEPVLRSQTIPVVKTRDQPVSGLIHVLEAVESSSHSVELYFQIGSENPEDRVLASVLEHLMAEPLYSELRTKQQLGYAIKCGLRSVCGTIGFVFEITSNVHGPEQLAKDVDDFLKTFRLKLHAMPSEEYVRNASSLAMRLLTKTRTLQEQAERHWNCILGQALYSLPYLWNVNLVDCALIRTVASKTRVLEAFDAWLDPVLGNRRRASVYVVGVGYKRDQLLKQLDKPWVTFIGSIQRAIGGAKQQQEIAGAAGGGEQGAKRQQHETAAGKKACNLM